MTRKRRTEHDWRSLFQRSEMLNSAIRSNDEKLFRNTLLHMSLAEAVDQNTQNTLITMSLRLSCIYRRRSMVEAILKTGKANAQCALDSAFDSGDPRIIKLLLDAGAFIEYIDEQTLDNVELDENNPLKRIVSEVITRK